MEEVLQSLTLLNDPNSSHEARQHAQHSLMAIQQDPNCLARIPSWLGSGRPELQFFAAQTLFQILALGELSYEEDFEEWCFNFTWALAPGLSPFIRSKWCQAMAILCIRMAMRGASDPLKLESPMALEILSMVPEELGVTTGTVAMLSEGPSMSLKASSDRLYKARHYFKEKRGMVIRLLEETASQSADRVWFACMRNWMAWGLDWQGGGMPRSLAKLAQTLQDPEAAGWEDAVGVLTDLAESSGEQVAGPLLELIMATWERTPEDRLFAVLISFAENHYDWIYSNFEEAVVTKFLEAMLQATATLEADFLSSLWGWWPQLQERIGQEGTQKEGRFQALFLRVLQACLQRALRLKNRDLGEAVLASWRILGASMLQYITSLLSSTQDKSLAEACLWAAAQAAEEFDPAEENELEGLVLRESLSELLRAASVWGLNDQLVTLIGAAAHALDEATLSAFIPSLISCMPSKPAELALLEIALVQSKVLQPHVTALLAWVPKAPRLARIIAVLLDYIPDPVQRLECWQQCVATLPADQMANWIRSTKLSSVPEAVLQQQGETIRSLISFLTLQVSDPSHFAMAVDVAEAMALCLEWQWELFSGHLTQSILATSKPESLSYAATCLSVLRKDSPMVPFVLNSLLQQVCTPSLDDEMLQAACEAIQRIIIKRLDLLLSFDLRNLLFPSVCQRMQESRTISTTLLKAMVRVHTGLLESTAHNEAERQWIDQMYLNGGAVLLVSSLFLAARQTLARSQLDSAGRLLYELAQRYPSYLRTWLLDAQVPDAFIKQIVGVKTQRRFKSIFVEFIGHL